MSETSDRYQRVSANFSRLVESVPDDGWEAPSPCPDWTARDVAAHVINMQRRVVANLDGTSVEDIDPEGDLLAQWLEARSGVLSTLADPALAAKQVGGMFGEMTFEELTGRLLCSDTLIHSWDLAQASNQEDRLDAEAAAIAIEALTPYDEALRVPGGFGPKIEPAPGADDRTRLLNFSGRQP